MKNLRAVDKNALTSMCKALSMPNLVVECSAEHILDRAKERNIDVLDVLAAMSKSNKDICLDLFEASLRGGSRGFQKQYEKVKLYYSVYCNRGIYKVVYRTVVK